MRASDLNLPEGMEVYVDMDGVVADFFTEYAKLAGVHTGSYRDIPPAKVDPTLDKMVGTDFFARLPKFPTADKLLQIVVDAAGSYNICSSPLRGDHEGSGKYKNIWIKKHLSPQPKHIYIVANKAKYAKNANGLPNVLIDDRGSNISAWEAAGGIGIKYQADEDSLKVVLDGLKRARRVAQGEQEHEPQKLSSLDRGKMIAVHSSGDKEESINSENFADGKHPGRKGLAKRSGVNTKASVSSLRNTAKHSTGEKARMAHWLANMKAGRAKHEDVEEAKFPFAGAAVGQKEGPAGQLKAKDPKGYPKGKLVGGTEDIDNEGWKDVAAAGALATGLAFGGAGTADAKSQPTTHKPSVIQQVSKKDIAKSVTGNPHEVFLRKAAEKAGIVGHELTAFLSQCAHETLDFKHMKEIGGSLDFRKYDPKYAPRKAKQLGNKDIGDGAKYKGRGYIQLTGRENYKKAGAALGLPLEKHPELVEKPEVAAKVAVWYWKNRVAPNVDSFKDNKAVTKTINPGMKHLDQRADKLKSFQVAMR